MKSPAISIRQPWPHAIFHLGKDIENRTWTLPKKYQNTPLLIHAGKSVDDDAVDFLTCLRILQSGQPEPDAYPKGGIIGKIVFGQPVRDSQSQWAEPGLWHWPIIQAVPLPFMPCKGRLGFFNVDYPHELYKVIE